MYNISEISKYLDSPICITARRGKKAHFNFIFQNQFALGDTFIRH